MPVPPQWQELGRCHSPSCPHSSPRETLHPAAIKAKVLSRTTNPTDLPEDGIRQEVPRFATCIPQGRLEATVHLPCGRSGRKNRQGLCDQSFKGQQPLCLALGHREEGGPPTSHRGSEGVRGTKGDTSLEPSKDVLRPLPEECEPGVTPALFSSQGRG